MHKEFLSKLFDEGIIHSLLVPLKKPGTPFYFPALIKSKEFLSDASISPMVMPVSAATEVSKITRVSSPSKTIGVVLRPCEIRALVELVKLKQINLDNILIIGTDCEGTYTPEDYEELKPEKIDKEKIREVCKICEYPEPPLADIILGFYGGEGIEARSPKGEEILKKLGIEKGFDREKRREEIERVKKERQEKAKQILEATREKVSGIENLTKFFGSCINCHNCMKECPICYCNECFFESEVFRFEGERYLSWVERRGTLQLPRDELLFHLGRMNHMGLSCIGCGMCEQSCPRDIEVAHLFILIGREGQREFGYTPGTSLEEPLPLATFKEDEFVKLGEEKA